jgi:hypothetical protein
MENLGSGFISTSTTTIHSTRFKNSFVFKKEKTGLIAANGFLGLQFVDVFPKGFGEIVDLVSDQPKVFIGLTASYFHLYHDHIGEFLSQYELTPDAKFVIDISAVADMNPLPPYIKMFFKILNDKKIDYISLDLRKIKKINIDNFYYRDRNVESLEINNPSSRIRDIVQDYIKDKNAPADKKVFLSRKNFQGRDLSLLIKGRLPYENDNRIDNEELLQKYFKSLGFDVVVPEDFKSFEDQINYFDKAKILVSTTSSGFTNAAFMRPGSLMFELTTPLISFASIGNGVTSPLSQCQEEIHHFYHMMSIALGHNYVSIPNKERSAEKIISIIDNSKVLKDILQLS